ncbi:hypothetical protein ACFV1W_20840 [Kitasatospora sp. NPDC059648]|uniref:hypothetical protein n=1 Tax=Kitasatospora sp. NPDC059648 TaxID=3346894 RepID=UPI0036A3EA08
MFELDDGYPGGDPAMSILCILPLLLLPFAVGARGRTDHGRAALRWFLRAVAHYAIRFLGPTVLLLSLVGAAYGGGTWGSGESMPELVLLTALVIGGPVALALLMVAPWAARGSDTRLALAVLANLVPFLLVMLGGLPAVLVIVVHVVFACRVGPAAPLRGSRSDGA